MGITVEYRHLIKSCDTAEIMVLHVCISCFLGKDGTLVGCVAHLAERRTLAGELTLSSVLTLSLSQPTSDHYVGKPSATSQPTRPTQPFIPPMCAQVAPSGKCLRGYKPGRVIGICRSVGSGHCRTGN